MPGLWHLSGQQPVDSNGRPFPGALAYFLFAGTTTPKTPYAEATLGTQLPNPVRADGNGAFPSVFFDDSDSPYIRYRVETTAGDVVREDVTVPLIGANTEGGEDPPAPIEASAIFKTGDEKIRYDTNEIEGWLLEDGSTFGSASSGADYANDNAQALYVYLWQKDATLVVAGGRGASAAADWGANKPMDRPDMRGYALAGLDNMGGSAAGRLTGLTSLGARIGASLRTLLAANIPLLSFTTSAGGSHNHTYDRVGQQNVNSGGTFARTAFNYETGTTSTAPNHTHTGSVGTATPASISIVQPTAGRSFYIKL